MTEQEITPVADTLEMDEQHEEKLKEIDQMEKRERRDQMKEELQARLKDESIWLRLLQLIVFGFAFVIGSWVLFGTVILQFLLRLFTGEPNIELLRFGKNLGRYFRQMIDFAMFNSEDAPFPFSAWPNETD